MSDQMAKAAVEGNFLDRIQKLEREIELLKQREVKANSINEISDDLGLMQAGEFRAGNGSEPGEGFSGTRVVYPAVEYNGEEFHIVGANNDVLQFGLSALDGAGVFGSGKARLDGTGIYLQGLNQAIKYFAQTLDEGAGRADRNFTIAMRDISEEASFGLSYYGDVTLEIATNPTFDGADETERKSRWIWNDDADLAEDSSVDDSGYCAYLPALGSIEIEEYDIGGGSYGQGFAAGPGGYKISFYANTTGELRCALTFWKSIGNTPLAYKSVVVEVSDWHQEEMLVIAPPGTTEATLVFYSLSGDSYVDSIFVQSVNSASELAFEPHPLFRGTLGIEDLNNTPSDISDMRLKRHNLGGYNHRLWMTDGAGRLNDMVGVPKPNMKRLPAWFWVAGSTTMSATGSDVTELGTSNQGTYLPETNTNFITGTTIYDYAGFYGNFFGCLAKVRYARFRCGWKDNTETNKVFYCGFSGYPTAPLTSSSPYYRTNYPALMFMYKLGTDYATNSVAQIVVINPDIWDETYVFTTGMISETRQIDDLLQNSLYFDVEFIVTDNDLTVNFYQDGTEIPTLTFSLGGLFLDVYERVAPVCGICTFAAAAKEFTFYRAYLEMSTESDDVIGDDPIEISEDTFLNQANPTTNYGTNNDIQVGEADDAVSLSRGLIRWASDAFDAYTTDDEFIAVYLNVYVNTDKSSAVRTLEVYRCLVDWTEGGATWNTSDGSTAWGTAGCGGADVDYDSTLIGSISLAAAPSAGWYRFLLDPVLFKEFILNADSLFYGLLLKGTTEASDKYYFDSSEKSSGANTPYVQIYRKGTGELTNAEYTLAGGPV